MLGRSRREQVMSAKTLDQSEQVGLPISGQGSGLDRRCRPRLRLALPVVLFRTGETGRIETITEDISCDSFYFVSDHPFSPDDLLECELLIPGDGVSSVPEDDLCVHGGVRVIRVEERGPKMGFGVACRLEDYKVSRSAR
jgi:hypothetical protein